MTTIPLIVIISEIRLNVGGAAILDIKIKNQNTGMALDQIRIPLVRSRLREWFLWYKRKDTRNIPEDLAPWANISIKAPVEAIKVLNIKAPRTKAIWLTEE
jgi:hypothetical protein